MHPTSENWLYEAYKLFNVFEIFVLKTVGYDLQLEAFVIREVETEKWTSRSCKGYIISEDM
jgi:hypothetical protein